MPLQTLHGLWRGEVIVLGASEKALHASFEGEQMWIPLSQIHDD